jgi:N-acetylmuramoyl-L-alanine amidase
MPRVALIVFAVLMFVVPEAASADFIHVVAPGETLTSVAAADGLTVDQLAAANGISPYTQLIAGTGIAIPPQQAAPAEAAAGAGAEETSAGGAYVVQPGDTLTAIAARAGLSVAQLAADNGIDPNAPLLAGAVLQLSGTSGTTSYVSDSSSSAASSQPVGGAAEGDPTEPPYPTPQTLSAGQIASIAHANGVSPSLADAIAYQESGFNNDLVSSADARGIMQILPGTWQWIQSDLNAGGPPLAPASATDNVRGGVLMLHSLLDSTGGDPAMAAAGYYQGLPSVQQNGVYPSTQQYVNSVMALSQRFGGG